MAPRGTQPPYTTAADIESFFDRIGNKQPPTKLDTDWVENYDIAANQASGITTMVKWLGIVDDNESAKPDIWNKLRQPASRSEALAPLVREAYSAVFERISVEDASTDDLNGVFIDAYGVGDAKKKVRCFVKLCELAGIPTATAIRESRPTESRPTPGDGSGSPVAKKPAAPLKKRTVPNPPASKLEPPPAFAAPGVTIVLNVEILAEWTEEQIRERISVVKRAVDSAGH